MKQGLVMAVIALSPAASLGSGDEAWEEFRAAVDQSCRALVEAPETATVSVEVNPFGSESYGAALVTIGVDGGTERLICIHDKRSGTTELTGPFSEDTATDQQAGSAAKPLGQP